MSEAGRLLERDIHPLVIVKGYQLAMQITLDEIENRSKTVGDNLEKVSRTALVGRSTEGAMSHLASLIAQSVNAIPDSDYERVRMSKAGEGTAATSELIPGILIEKRLALERMPKNLLDTKVAVLSCPLELENSVVSSEIEISTPEQYQAFIDEENNQIEKMIQKVKSSGAQAVFSAESIDSRALHSLADSGIFAMGGLERPIAEDVAQACGAALCDHLDDLSNSLGHADGLTHERLEGPEGVKERLIIEVGKDAGIVTILVRRNRWRGM